MLRIILLPGKGNKCGPGISFLLKLYKKSRHKDTNFSDISTFGALASELPVRCTKTSYIRQIIHSPFSDEKSDPTRNAPRGSALGSAPER